jgi:polygalacturonase
MVRSIDVDSPDMELINLGIRIKTISGDTGSVTGVTYKDITLSGITKYGIVVNQAYDGTAGSPTSGVPITNFVLNNVKGTVDSTATDIYIECGSGSCSSWTWTGVAVTGGKVATNCLNVPSGASCSD